MLDKRLQALERHLAGAGDEAGSTFVADIDEAGGRYYVNGVEVARVEWLRRSTRARVFVVDIGDASSV